MYYNNIINNFNRAANNYKDIAMVQKQTAVHLINHLRANLHGYTPQKILDIGAGTGFIPDILLNHFPHAHYVLNDIAPAMLELVAKKFSPNSNITFHLGNAEESDFAAQDLIISNLAFQWFKNLTNTLANLWDKTNVLAFTTLTDGTFSSWKKLHQDLGLVSGMRNYPTAAELNQYYLSLEPQHYFFTTQTYKLDFANPLLFARYLKQLGANTSHTNYQGNNLLKILKSSVANTKFTTNYEVLFTILIKKPRELL